jgi:hypothetical protein
MYPKEPNAASMHVQEYCTIIIIKKNNPLYLTSQQLCFWAFPWPHQSPSSWPDLENRRNRIIQLQMPCISLVKWSRPFLQCVLQRVCPIPTSILSTAHKWQEWVPAVDIKPILFDCHKIFTLIIFQHQVATSTLDANERSFALERRCHTRAELASGWVSGGLGGNGRISWGVLGSMLWVELFILESLRTDR